MSPSKESSAPAVFRTGDVGRVVARLARQVEHGLAAVDLTVAQYRVLVLLADGSAASSSLADRLTVSPPSVTAVVDGLVTRGLVVRSPDPDDRRRWNLALTDDGIRVLHEADDSVAVRLDAIAAHLPPDSSDAFRALAHWQVALDGYREERRQVKARERESTS